MHRKGGRLRVPAICLPDRPPTLLYSKATGKSAKDFIGVDADGDFIRDGRVQSANPSSSSSSASGGRFPNPRGEPLDDGPVKVEEWAKQLIPEVPGCKLSREEIWHSRWKVTYPTPPEERDSHNAMWTETVTPITALKDVLEWVWRQHFKMGRSAHSRLMLCQILNV